MSIRNTQRQPGFEHENDPQHEGTQTPQRRILFVGERDQVWQALVRHLEGEGHRISATGGVDVGRVCAGFFDLIVLNRPAAGVKQISWCRALRPHFANSILMLADNNDEATEIIALDAGADDVQHKDIPSRLLLARVNALMRRAARRQAQREPVQKVAIQDLVLSHASRSVTGDAGPLDMSTLDFELLWLMATRPNETWSRDELSVQLRGLEFDGANRSVDMRVSSLRKSLGDNRQAHRYIATIRNEGYRLLDQ
jgi:DNA-binding response OmpR family regulator